MEAMMQDVRFALRQIRRAPMVSAFIVATLAIGIGATAVIFSAVDTMLLRPIYHDEHQLVKISGEYKNRGNDWSVSLPNASDWGSLSHSFSGLGWFRRASVTLGGGTPDRLQVALTTPEALRLLGAAPQLGRLYTAENAEPEGERVILLNDGVWRSRFASDPAIVGKSVEINGRPATVIGVMPAGFAFPSADVAAYMPLRANVSTWPRSNGGLQVLARMRPGVDIESARRDLDALSRRLASEYPESNKELSAYVRPFRESLVGNDMAKALYLLGGAVMLVLLIACVNVASLLLARATEREREIAVRAALGAGRGRVVRQMLTEGVILATFGGVAGVVLAALAIRALPSAIPADASLPRGFSLDWRVLAFSMAVTLFTGIAFSVLPAFKATATDLTSLMGVRSGRGGKRQRQRRGALVVVEVALAVVLLASTGLAVHGLSKLLQTNPGFRVENLLTARVPLEGRYRDSIQARMFEGRVIDNVRALPGVESVSLVDYSPMSGTSNFNDVTIEGRQSDKPDNVGTLMASAGYLGTMGIPILAGRDLDVADTRTSPGVIVVNRAFAEKMFGRDIALGKRVLFSWEGGKNPYWRTIVGVYGNVLHSGLDTEKQPQRAEVIVPISQLPFTPNDVGLVVRTRTDPALAVADIRRAVTAADPSQPLFDVKTMRSLIASTDDVLLGRILASVLAAFGAIAILLAAVGLYGVISYSVAQRTFEIGVRSALGADRGAVMRMIMGQGTRLVVLGLLGGLGGAYLAARLLRSLLHGVSPADPLSFIATCAILLSIAGLATWVPALRASRIEPSVALREN